MITIYETEFFKVQIPNTPYVDRLEGSHLRIDSKINISDRTKLTREQAIEYTKLSMVFGEALNIALNKRGIDIGIVNYQDMGNWSVFEPGGPILHMHLFGRAKSAKVQIYGDAVLLPHKETGFYKDFMPLNDNDIEAILTVVNELMKSEKYNNF